MSGRNAESVHLGPLADGGLACGSLLRCLRVWFVGSSLRGRSKMTFLFCDFG